MGVACGYVSLPGTGAPSRPDARAAGLDRGSGGDLLDLLPGEIDDRPVWCRQVLEQIAVAVRRLSVGCVLLTIEAEATRCPHGNRSLSELREDPAALGKTFEAPS